MMGRIGPRFVGWFGIMALLGGCQRGAPQQHKTSQVAPSASALQAPARMVTPELDRAELGRVIDRWQRAQNEGSTERYRELYAEDFVGVKRVGEHTLEMKREEWLQDRQRMSLKTPRVDISGLQFYAKGDEVTAEFRQKWATESFADDGTKALTLRRRNGEWQIVREAMLASRVLSEAERAAAPGMTGHCERLRQKLDERERAGQVWRFADISGDLVLGKWTRVSSWAEADDRTTDGDVWLSATVVSDGEWLWASTSDFSRTGDSAILTERCYRPDGTLARLIDAYRTFNTGQGLGEDLRTTFFDEAGKPGFSTRKTYLLESGEPLDPSGMMGNRESAPIRHVSRLPYFELLPEEARKRYWGR